MSGRKCRTAGPEGRVEIPDNEVPPTQQMRFGEGEVPPEPHVLLSEDTSGLAKECSHGSPCFLPDGSEASPRMAAVRREPTETKTFEENINNTDISAD